MVLTPLTNLFRSGSFSKTNKLKLSLKIFLIFLLLYNKAFLKMVDSKTAKMKIEDSDMVENIPVELIQRGITITDKEEKENKIIFLEVTIIFK